MKCKEVWLKGDRTGCRIEAGDKVWDSRTKQYATVTDGGDKNFKWTKNNILAFDPVVPTVRYSDDSKRRMNTPWLWKIYLVRRCWRNLWGILMPVSVGWGRTHFWNEPTLYMETS